MKKKSKQKSVFHAPLHPLDSEKQTFGCRHTNPIICSRHNLPSVCAFARSDSICLAPPLSWPKQFMKLRDEKSSKSENDQD